MNPGTKKALKERFIRFELQYTEAGINRSTASVDYDLTDISETATNFNYIIRPNIYERFSRPERRALERLGCDVIFSGTIRICNYCSDKKSKKNKNIDELDNE